MAKSIVATCPSWGSNYGAGSAGLRITAQAISDILTAGGWVQTADTGQTASNALVSSTAVNTLQGYQIWRMNDSLQSTAPIFMRIEYISGQATYASSVYGYTFTFTIGSGSNGAGTITGASPKKYIWSGNPNSSTYNSYFFANSSSFRFVICPTSGAEAYFSIDRTKDASNANTAAGFTTVAIGQNGYGSGSGISSYLHFFAGTQRTYNSQLLNFLPAGATTLASNTTVQLLSINAYNLEGNAALTDSLLYFTGDLSPLNPVSLSNNGIQSTFLPLQFVTSNGLSVAMRWE